MEQAHLQERLDAFVGRCRAEGIRVTPQRLEILKALLGRQDHPSADELHEELHAHLPGLSVDTVYRTLGTLQRLGLVQRLEVLDDRGRFEANPLPHHHLVCTRCRRVWDVEWEALDRTPVPEAAQEWGRVERPHAELRGVCRECMAAEV